MTDKPGAILDCGHPNDWLEGFGARDLNKKSMCKACAHANEVAHFALRHSMRMSVMAYLSADHTTITDWSGGKLATRTGAIRKSGAKSAAMGHNPRGLWTFRAVDVNGKTWACRHWHASGDYVRLYPVKDKRKP